MENNNEIRSTWVEIHVCLQQIIKNMIKNIRSTWVEIHVCLQPVDYSDVFSIRSTWVEIHVCLQLNTNLIKKTQDLHE